MDDSLRSPGLTLTYSQTVCGCLQCHFGRGLEHTMLSKFKYVFMFCNTLIIGSSIFGFIWGNINYAEYWPVNGSFIGGQLATICVGFIIMGLLALYASYKNNYQIICSYAVLVLMSLTLRIVTWLLAFFHHYRLKTWYYAYLAIEIVLLILAVLVMRNISVNHPDRVR